MLHNLAQSSLKLTCNFAQQSSFLCDFAQQSSFLCDCAEMFGIFVQLYATLRSICHFCATLCNFAQHLSFLCNFAQHLSFLSILDNFRHFPLWHGASFARRVILCGGVGGGGALAPTPFGDHKLSWLIGGYTRGYVGYIKHVLCKTISWWTGSLYWQSDLRTLF